MLCHVLSKEQSYDGSNRASDDGHITHCSVSAFTTSQPHWTFIRPLSEFTPYTVAITNHHSYHYYHQLKSHNTHCSTHTSGKTLWVSDSHRIDGCSQGIPTTLGPLKFSLVWFSTHFVRTRTRIRTRTRTEPIEPVLLVRFWFSSGSNHKNHLSKDNLI